MKDRMLLKTNMLICFVIVVGFLLTAVLSYHANYSASIENIENVSALTSEGSYYQIKDMFSKPINVSLTMANDSLLREFLERESDHLENPAYISTLQEYLETYKIKYEYDSVFLVSSATARYYNFNGLDRVLEPGDPENAWYYDGVLNYTEDYGMQVDNDEVEGADNAITVFVNCKIKSNDGSLLGVVGVGVRINSMQQMFRDYQEQFGMKAYLVDDNGTIEVSTQHSGYEQVNLFDLEPGKAQSKGKILNWKKADSALSFWNLSETGQKQDYIIARYLPELKWHLVVEQDTGELMRSLNSQLALTVAVIAVILSIILVFITHVIRQFNRQIVRLTQSVERERQAVFQQATEQLFENIYELDITNNRPANQAAQEYFESLGAPPGILYDKALPIIAKKQIKEEFRQGYLDTFLPDKVMQAYEQGRRSLHYEFMITKDGTHYYWMRITARIVKSESDQTIHMLTYRQNIDAEKCQEQRMQKLAQMDEMTGLITKTATRRQIGQKLKDYPEAQFAFFIFDIDNFKQANDLYGHAFGDTVIQEFANTIRRCFRREDIIGRIGGDEFVAFFSLDAYEQGEKKAEILCDALKYTHTWNDKAWKVSASIGVAFSPWDGSDFDTLYCHADAALYQTKEQGRGGFTFYQSDKVKKE